MLTSLVASLLLAAGGPPDATPAAPTPAPDAAPAAPAPAADPAVAPAPAPAAPTRVAPVGPARLPDGTFVGALEGGGETPMTLRLEIVGGLLTRGEVRRGALVIALRPTGAPGDLGLRFGGRTEKSFIKISGSFWDPERAEGRFDGTLEGQQVAGTWQLARR